VISPSTTATVIQVPASLLSPVAAARSSYENCHELYLFAKTAAALLLNLSSLKQTQK